MMPIFDGRAIVEHVEASIKRAPLVWAPFPYLFAEDVFPSQFYAALLASVPSGVVAHIEASGASKSGENLLHAKYADLLSNRECEVWGIAKSAMRAAHAVAQERLSGCVEARWAELADMGYVPRAMAPLDMRHQLLCRHEAFEIGPHVHHMCEIIDALLYLPDDDSHAHQGTELYRVARKTDLSFVGVDYAAIDGSAIERVAVIPYRANSMSMWVNTFDAIHAAHHGPQRAGGGGIERRYLFTYSVVPEAVRDDGILSGTGQTVTLEPKAEAA